MVLVSALDGPAGTIAPTCPEERGLRTSDSAIGESCVNWLTELSGPAPSAAGQAWSDVLRPSDVSSSPVELIAVVAVV